MKDPVRRDSLLTVMGLALLVAFFMFFVYLPNQRTATQLNREIAAAEQSIRDIPVRLAELELLGKELALRNDYLKETERLMPADADLHAVVRQVADLAENSGLTVTQLKPLPKTVHQSYQVFPFQVGLQGGFRGIATFLKGLEVYERLFTVEEFSLTAENERIEQLVDADMHFSVYVRCAESSESADNNASSHRLRADTEIR